MYLGIDAGGTHTDAVLIEGGRLRGAAKVPTDHENLPASMAAALEALALPSDLRRVRRVTLGSTLAVNALVQGRTDPVGLALTAGPGLAPGRFALGAHVHVAPGGLDHRGVEVTPLETVPLRDAAAAWHKEGVRVFAVAGKFSPRNPAHEKALAQVLEPLGHVTQGHQLSGLLNYPRRVASAWYNSAVWRLHNNFVDAVESGLRGMGIHAPAWLLKADGGAVALEASRRHPVDSILSGPAASVMGVLALCDVEGDSLLLDMGGTTTDVALYASGSPVLDRDGMRVEADGVERRTHVRALAAQSLGVGGDSRLSVEEDRVRVGPWRDGPAMAFGGTVPTLLDALNVLEDAKLIGQTGQAGQGARSRQGVAALALEHGMEPMALAHAAVEAAVQTIARGVARLVEHINQRPVYTLTALLEDRAIQPLRVWLVGGPAAMMRGILEKALGLPVHVPPYADVANAVGAALTLPTAELELLADTTRGSAWAPALEWERSITRQYTLDAAREDARNLLLRRMAEEGTDIDQNVEILEADMFATLDESGRGGKDIRVRCQLVPGIVQKVW